MNIRWIIAALTTWLGWKVLNAELLIRDPLATILVLILAFLCVRPLLVWIARGFKNLPVLEAHCVIHLPAYVMPVLEMREDVFQWGTPTVTEALAVVIIYLALVQIMGELLWVRARERGGWQLQFFDRRLKVSGGNWLVWGLLIASCLWTVLVALRLVPALGTASSIVSSAAGVAGKIGLFFLFYQAGRGHLTMDQKWTAVLIVGIQWFFGLLSGFLNGVTAEFLVVILAWCIGAKRIPWKSAIAALAFLSILHAGKGDMRARYWKEGTNYSENRLNPLEVYPYWFWSGIRKFTDENGNVEEIKTRSMLNRVSVMHWLILTVHETPDRLPYLYGDTYVKSPALWIPRVFWPAKPRATQQVEALAMYYGVQSEESVETTSIGLGLLAEAWANFGWFGPVFLGGFMGWLFSIPLGMGFNRSLQSVGAALSVGFLGTAFILETALGYLLHGLSNVLVVLVVGCYFMSEQVARRKRKVGRFAPVKRSNMQPKRFRGNGLPDKPSTVEKHGKPQI